MRQVQLKEQDGQLATLLSEVEAGESVTILRSGRPVAQIIPFPIRDDDSTASSEERRVAAIARLDAIMKKGLNLGGVWNGREELYEPDDAVKRRAAAICEMDALMEEGIPLGGTAPTRDEMHDDR